MDHLSSLEAFIAVVEKGSFTAAARALRLSTTMIGKHVKQLEGRVSLRLLQRTTRRLSLTEAGKIYYERARRVLEEVADADEGVRALHAQPRGLLHVSCPVTFGVQKLAPAVAQFLATNPHIRIDLVLQDHPVDLIAGGFDAAFWVGSLSDSSLIGRKLRPYRTLLAAAPSYLAQRGTPKRPADLAQHNCLGFAHWDRQDRWRLVDKKSSKIQAVETTGNFIVDHGFALRTAALAGLGVIMQPEVLLAEDLSAQRLVRVLPQYEPPARPMHLLYAADRTMTAKLKAFIDFSLTHFT